MGLSMSCSSFLPACLSACLPAFLSACSSVGVQNNPTEIEAKQDFNAKIQHAMKTRMALVKPSGEASGFAQNDFLTRRFKIVLHTEVCAYMRACVPVHVLCLCVWYVCGHASMRACVYACVRLPKKACEAEKRLKSKHSPVSRHLNRFCCLQAFLMLMNKNILQFSGNEAEKKALDWTLSRIPKYSKISLLERLVDAYSNVNVEEKRDKRTYDRMKYGAVESLCVL